MNQHFLTSFLFAKRLHAAAEAAPYWQRVKARAIERAAAMHEAQQAAVRSVADNVHQVQEAAKVRVAGGGAVDSAVMQADVPTSPDLRMVAAAQAAVPTCPGPS